MMATTPRPLDVNDLAARLEQRYRELAATAAADEPIDEAELLRVLAATGHSLPGFRTHVARLRSRIEALEVLSGGQAEAWDAKLRAAKEAVDATKEHLDGLRAEWTRKLGEAAEVANAAASAHAAIFASRLAAESQARQVLQRTGDPKLAAELIELARWVNHPFARRMNATEAGAANTAEAVAAMADVREEQLDASLGMRWDD